MFRKTLTFLGALLIALVPVFVAYLLSQAIPDVRYTLSEKIPVSFAGVGSTPTENIQQLEVKNIGTSQAHRIVVKITGNISSHEIQKYTSSDNPQVYNSQNSMELVYPDLPPQAGFKLVFKSPGSIEYSNLVISHSGGLAKEALSKPSDGIILQTLSLSYFLGMVFFLLLSANNIKKASLDSWKFDVERKSPDLILVIQKPWYVLNSKWPTLHTYILKSAIERDRFNRVDIDRSAAYKFLSVQKPEHIDSIEWKEIIRLGSNTFERICSDVMNGHSEPELLRLIKLERPMQFDPDKWNDIVIKSGERFISLRGKYKLYNVDSLMTELKKEKSDDIPEHLWLGLRTYLQSELYNILCNELDLRANPIAFLDSQTVNVLNEKQISQLKQHANKKLRYDQLLRVFDMLLNSKSIGSQKPEYINDIEWEQLKNFDKHIAQLHSLEAKEKEVNNEIQKLNEETKETAILRVRIEKQLNLINSLLNDPTAIDRIEAYDDTFSKGNFENLAKIAQLLSTYRDSKGNQ